MDPPEIGVHAPPLQETVANEEELEELEDPSAPQRSNGPENGVNEKPPPKFEAFEAESPNQEDPIIPDALPGPSSNKKTKIEDPDSAVESLSDVFR